MATSAVAFSFFGVNQATPTRTEGHASTNNASSISVAATTVVDDLCVAIFAWETGGAGDSSNLPDPTDNASQTRLGTQVGDSSTSLDQSARLTVSTKVATTTSTTVGYTMNAFAQQTLYNIPIVPAVAPAVNGAFLLNLL